MTASLTLARPDPEQARRGAAERHLPAGHAARRLGGRQGERRGGLRPVAISRWRDETALIASGVQDGEIVATAGVHKLEPGRR
jgi:hypothetical protein